MIAVGVSKKGGRRKGTMQNGNTNGRISNGRISPGGANLQSYHAYGGTGTVQLSARPLHVHTQATPATIATSTAISSGAASANAEKHFVVAAIDFGTTYSGYAFSFTRDPDSIHMMRKWEGGDPGVTNQKTPTTLLLRPNGEFHSFGFGARDHYHDLEESETKKWYYFEKFKMSLHSNQVSWMDAEGGERFIVALVYLSVLTPITKRSFNLLQ